MRSGLDSFVFVRGEVGEKCWLEFVNHTLLSRYPVENLHGTK